MLKIYLILLFIVSVAFINQISQKPVNVEIAQSFVLSNISDYFREKTCKCDGINDMIIDSELKKPCVYKDSLENPTIGIGFNLERKDARSKISAL